MDALNIQRLHKVYPRDGQEDLEAIREVTFGVGKGEFVSIVGPSGCGKTTLLMCIAGLRSVTGGHVLLYGTEVTSPPKEMALIFQEYGRTLLPWRTVLNNVIFGMENRPEIARSDYETRARDALRHVGLAGYERAYPWHLSGGQQQRVAIARGLANGPDDGRQLHLGFGVPLVGIENELGVLLHGSPCHIRLNVLEGNDFGLRPLQLVHAPNRSASLIPHEFIETCHNSLSGLLDCPPDNIGSDLLTSLHEPDQESEIREGIHFPRNASTRFIYRGNGFRRKHNPRRSGRLHPKIDIVADFVHIERHQVIPNHNPLGQLLDRLHFAPQFRLTKQDQGQQKPVVKLKIQEQSQFLENCLVIDGLCFIDDQDGILFLLEILQ